MGRVIYFADKNGYDGYVMLNLSPQRATKSGDLLHVFDDKMHRENLNAIAQMTNKYPNYDILLAYGNGINIRFYLRQCMKDIYQTLKSDCGRWLIIGKPTVLGHPRHPLYAKRTLDLTEFDVEKYISKFK